jgi:hypothetical protein
METFRQSGDDLRATFDTLGFGSRLCILEPGCCDGHRDAARHVAGPWMSSATALEQVPVQELNRFGPLLVRLDLV